MIRAHGGFALVLIGFAVVALWLWGFGGATQVSQWAAAQQREVQGDLAGALRAVRSGQPMALAGLLGLCFAYGFFHAAGPGHGKLVMGGYALGEDVPRLRLIVLTLAGSLGQALTAILLVGAGALLFGWGRVQLTGLADGALAAFSAGAIVLVGLWLLWRGVRRYRSAGHTHRHDHDHDHGHDHGHDHHHDHDHDHDDEHGHGHACGGGCGHAHGPDPRDVAKANTWREGAALVAAVAIRPCTGAIFVLILTFSMGIPVAGILGALVMGLGTALLTLAVALGAGHLRGGLAERWNGPGGIRAMAVVEVCAGLVVAVLAGQMALRLV